jgi:hypothetical protein
MTYALNQTKRN